MAQHGLLPSHLGQAPGVCRQGLHLGRRAALGAACCSSSSSGSLQLLPRRLEVLLIARHHGDAAPPLHALPSQREAQPLAARMGGGAGDGACATASGELRALFQEFAICHLRAHCQCTWSTEGQRTCRQ